MSQPIDQSNHLEHVHASEEALAAYALDWDDTGEQAQHIAACAHCLQEVELYRALLDALDRVGCPAPDQVEAYALDEPGMDATAHAEIARHVHQCSYCSQDVAVTRSIWLEAQEEARQWSAAAQRATEAAPDHASTSSIAQQEPALSLSEAVRRVWAYLLPDHHVLNPAYSVRGQDHSEEEGRLLRFAVAGVEGIGLALYLRAERGALLLSGTISHPETPDYEPSSVRLRRVDEATPESIPNLVAETPVIADGFEFEGVPAGRYQIEVLFPDQLVVVAIVDL